jgi:hypothetical protein
VFILNRIKIEVIICTCVVVEVTYLLSRWDQETLINII